MAKSNNSIYLKISLFILIAFLNSCRKERQDCSFITDYHPLVIRAEIEYEKKNYKKAYKLLKKAFTSCEPRNTVTYYEIDKMAKITAHLGLVEESLDMIKRQIKQEGFTINRYKSDTLFDKILQSKKGIELIKEADLLRNEYLKGIDTSLVSKLIKMSACDQQYRKNRNYYDENQKQQNKLDSINELQLIEIFESYGFPGEHLKRYAYPEMIRIEAILLHTEDSIREKYFLPKLEEFLKSGKCDPRTYAVVYDQLLIYDGLPQKYGTYNKSDGSLTSSVPLDEVNKNRISIGLPSLGDKKTIHELKIVNYPNSYGKFHNKY